MNIYYIKEIRERIELINSVLGDINISHLFDNSDFSIDDMSSETWLKINLRHNKPNKIPLWIIISRDSIEVRLDRISEAIILSDESFTNARLLLKTVFTSYILVEYYGLSRTRIRLYNQEGKYVQVFNYHQGIPFWGKRESKLYFPIYPFFE